jgi:hypothetical protein
MYIQLEQSDYDLIAEMVAESKNGIGIEIEYSELCIKVVFNKHVLQHLDDDYYNGTGAWEVDSVDFTLGEIHCEGVEVKYNHKELEKTIIDYLWNR